MDKLKEKLQLEESLKIPIARIEFSETHCMLINISENPFLKIKFSKENNTNYYYYSSIMININVWRLIIEDYKDYIYETVKEFINYDTFTIKTSKPYEIEIFDAENSKIYTLDCYYSKEQWNLDFSTEHKFNIISNQLNSLRSDLKALPTNQNVIQPDPVANLLETVVKLGTPLFTE